MSKSVQYNSRNYYVNKVPAEFEKKPEWYLAQHNVNIVFAKHFDEFTHPGAEMRSWFDERRQPTEAQVRRAMIWGYDQFGDYQIKSGGGAISDNIFISQFKMTVADARTGWDKDVIVLKKYSNNFAEVLITPAELDALQQATESKAARNARRLGLLPSLLREIIRWEKGVTSTGNGQSWTEENILQMKKQCREDYTPEELRHALERLAEYASQFENRMRRGGTGRDFLNFVAAEISKPFAPQTQCRTSMSFVEQPPLFAIF